MNFIFIFFTNIFLQFEIFPSFSQGSQHPFTSRIDLTTIVLIKIDLFLVANFLHYT